jgi:hypothetical protein
VRGGDGPPLEDVYFLRDDMAAMAWAVEQAVQGPLDAPVDAAQLALAFDTGFPPPPPPARVPGGPAPAYALEQIPPANWIPMVPVVAPGGAPGRARPRPGWSGLAFDLVKPLGPVQ